MVPAKALFFERKKNKPFCKFMRAWFKGKEYSDVVVAKNLSSMLTHSLIDMEGMSTPVFKALEISEQSRMLNGFLLGEYNCSELRDSYNSMYGAYVYGR